VSLSRLVPVLVLALLAGCGGEPAAAPPTLAAPPAAETAPTSPPLPDENPDVPVASSFIEARIEVVDLEGAPLPGMLAIVTTQANAFDKPLAMGAPTDAQGLGSVRAPNGAHLYLRAWDPEMRYFANNFYDLLPAQGGTTELLRIQMARGASLGATLARADGSPVGGESASVLLVHPTAGPWWPAKGTTTVDGVLRLESVPAGRYSLRIKTESGLQLEVPDVSLPPGSAPDIGALTLQ
jgi:hypothetical protein